MRNQDSTKYRAYIGEVGDDLEDALQKGLEFINWDRYVNKSSKVFVKPNFTFPYYKEGVTTNPEFLKRLLAILKSKAGSVVVGESDGGNHSFKAEVAFKNHGMYEICQEAAVELVNLSTLPTKVIETRVLSKKVRVQLPRILLEDIDCLISVAVLKVHVMTKVSLSLKNLWGCFPDTMRGLHHQNLSHMLALTARLLKPKIAIIDGTYGLNKHGPMYGEPVKTDLILMSDNPVVADSLGARVMGFSPQKIEHIAVAERAGIGSVSLEDADINGDWEKYKRQFEITKTLIDRASSLMFHSDAIARLVLASPLTPLIYKVAGLLRSSEEKELASQMDEQRTLGLY